MNWIKITDKLPPSNEEVCILIYENWTRNKDGSLKRYCDREDESWHVCSGSYSKYEWYIPCKPGIEGGFGNIYNDWDEGQLIYVSAWCPMPMIEKIK